MVDWKRSYLHSIGMPFLRTRHAHHPCIDGVLSRYDDLKTGTCIGADKYGNRYYQNTRYFVGQCSAQEFLLCKNELLSARSQSLGGICRSCWTGLRCQSNPTRMVRESFFEHGIFTVDTLGTGGYNTSPMIHQPWNLWNNIRGWSIILKTKRAQVKSMCRTQQFQRRSKAGNLRPRRALCRAAHRRRVQLNSLVLQRFPELSSFL